MWKWREILNKVFLHRIRLVSREASSRVSGARGKGAEQCLISHAWQCWASEGARKAECMLNRGGTSETRRNYPWHCCVVQTTAGGQMARWLPFPTPEPACDMNTCVLLSHKPETYGGVVQKEIKTDSAFYFNIRRKINDSSFL